MPDLRRYRACVALSTRLEHSPQPWIRLSPGQLEARQRVLAKLADGTYEQESVPCFCGLPEADLVIAERDRYGLPVRTALCQHCGILRTTPRMTADATARFYGDDYRDLYTGPGNVESLYESQVERGHGLVKLLTKLLPQVDSVYEIGCGAGGLLTPFAQAGKRVAGVDLGDEYLAYGRQQGLDLVHGRAGDLLAHRGEAADLVLLLHVLEHYLDLSSSLDETLSIVKPGGLLLVEVPGLATIATGYHGDILRYLQNAHTYHFSGPTLRFVLERCGLEVLACTEDAIALCRRPPGPKAGSRVPPPAGEAARNLRLLAELERKFLTKRAA